MADQTSYTSRSDCVQDTRITIDDQSDQLTNQTSMSDENVAEVAETTHANLSQMRENHARELTSLGQHVLLTDQLSDLNSQRDQDCALCSDPMHDGQAMLMHNTTCANATHADCMLKWLREKPTCPYCRERIQVYQSREPGSVRIHADWFQGADVFLRHFGARAGAGSRIVQRPRRQQSRLP